MLGIPSLSDIAIGLLQAVIGRVGEEILTTTLIRVGSDEADGRMLCRAL